LAGGCRFANAKNFVLLQWWRLQGSHRPCRPIIDYLSFQDTIVKATCSRFAFETIRPGNSIEPVYYPQVLDDIRRSGCIHWIRPAPSTLSARNLGKNFGRLLLSGDTVA
jgi:hypothetical protein